MRRPKIIRSNINPMALPHFFFAGRAFLTFRNNQTGTHMTVKVKQVTDKNDRKIKLPIFFVNVRLLDDKEVGYKYIGTIFQETMSVKLAKDVVQGTQLYEVMGFIMRSLKDPQTLRDKGVTLLHEGHCMRCGRQLTHPESINTGFGPDCLELVLASQKELSPDFFVQL